MKRLMVLTILAAFLLAGAALSFAADLKVEGELKSEAVWMDNWDASKGSKDGLNEDDFDIRTRARIVFRFVQSENLEAVIRLQYGTMGWGHPGSGGLVDTDSYSAIGLKRMYLSFKWPGESNLSFLVGKFSVNLPNNFGSSILGADTAAFLAQYKISDQIALAAGFARAVELNGRNNGTKNPDHLNDEWDHIFVLLPMTFDGFKVTPFANFSILGNSIPRSALLTENGTTGLLTPQGGSYHNGQVYPWWVGVSFDVSLLDPIGIKGDFNYGRVNDKGSVNDRSGWLADLEVSFNGLEWFVAKLFGLYATGEDSNTSNGSERMPNIVNDFAWGSFFYGGSALLVGDLDNPETGTWAVGASLDNIKFIDKLSHTATVMYINGTNHKSAASYLTYGRELTTKDHVWEIDFNTKYMIYEQLAAILELGYLINDYSKSTWGHDKADDSWKVGLGLQYTF